MVNGTTAGVIFQPLVTLSVSTAYLSSPAIFCSDKPQFGSWSAWAECSVTCGGGETVRSRPCQGGSVGDEGCESDLATQSEPCNTQKCGKLLYI